MPRRNNPKSHSSILTDRAKAILGQLDGGSSSFCRIGGCLDQYDRTALPAWCSRP